MTVLVTGGAGYIGSHTVRALVDKGRSVVVLDNLQKGHKQAVKGADLVIGDISNEELVTEIIKKYDVTSVIHFAADSLVEESMMEPRKYYHNNVIKTIKLLDAILKNSINKIVFSSTAAVYGSPKEVPIQENIELKPTNVYGRTKRMIENVLEDYDMAYGLKYIALRYFNAAGACVTGEIGEDHSPESHLIPIILQVALGKRDKLIIYGNDYHTKDGTCIRDYVHVSDLAEAHILALEALEGGKDSTIYNVGNGKGFSVKEIVLEIEKFIGKEIPKEISLRRPGDPDILIASIEKIKKELGWHPKYTLYDIIETAWRWHNSHPQGFEE
ncbi:UDP-glucose 4-epimerase GalE [Thermotalea metallivorans]|uniref:UDP-glucose 4-epimerase n=1 Tax=Thermotalea metallivorans TaxID=520762 RepID=A0A140L6W8_9FIRM|nr:UDP-glucose 4-epimerase GalE [Thermotalea metallivorans]KXG76293.1 UDP-glucose 4-epimerase [Thermotalea metallivorans]